MGAEQKRFFIAICDSCGEEFSEREDWAFSTYKTKEDLEEAVGYSGWIEKDGKFFCEGCWDQVRLLEEQVKGEGEVLGR